MGNLILFRIDGVCFICKTSAQQVSARGKSARPRTISERRARSEGPFAVDVRGFSDFFGG